MSLAEQVRDYIADRPALREAYRMGIVNFSALARRIAEDLDLRSSEALVSACRRYKPSLERSQEATIHRALEGSRMEVRTGVGLISFEQGWERLARLAEAIHGIADASDRLHLLHGLDQIQLVADERLLEQLSALLRQEVPVEERRGLTEINIRSPEDIENVPGFIAALTGSLAERGIRIVDATTCGHDHLLLIEDKDLAASVKRLDSLLSGHDNGDRSG